MIAALHTAQYRPHFLLTRFNLLGVGKQKQQGLGAKNDVVLILWAPLQSFLALWAVRIKLGLKAVNDGSPGSKGKCSGPRASSKAG